MVSGTGYGNVSQAPTTYQTYDFMQAYAEASFASPWIYSCVNVISNSLAQVPLKLYREAGGELVEVPAHALLKLFRDINPSQTYFNFIKATMSYLDLTGNCFWALERDMSNRIIEMWPLRPDYMKIELDNDGFPRQYTYTVGGEVVHYPVEDIIHIKTFSPTNHFWGISGLASVVHDINASYYSRVYNENFFQNGARPSGVVTVPGSLSKEDFDRAKGELQNNYGGYTKSNKIMLLDNGANFREVSVTPKDADFLEQEEKFKDKILSVFGVPPVMISDFSASGNTGSLKMQHRIFWENTIIPRAKLIESYIQEYLMNNFRLSAGLIPKFDFSNVPALREDEDKKTARAERLVRTGIWTVNEARKRFWDMEPLEGGDVSVTDVETTGEDNFNDVRGTFREETGRTDAVRGVENAVSSPLLELVKTTHERCLNEDEYDLISDIKKTINYLNAIDSDEMVIGGNIKDEKLAKSMLDIAKQFSDYEDIDDIDCVQFVKDVRDL